MASIESRSKLMSRLSFNMTNVNWAWCAVSHEKKQVMFFVWDQYKERGGERYLMLHDSWKVSQTDGKVKAGFNDAMKNIGFILVEGYQLCIVFQTATETLDYPRSQETAKVKSINHKSYFECDLERDGEFWFAKLNKRVNV